MTRERAAGHWTTMDSRKSIASTAVFFGSSASSGMLAPMAGVEDSASNRLRLPFDVARRDAEEGDTLRAGYQRTVVGVLLHENRRPRPAAALADRDLAL